MRAGNLGVPTTSEWLNDVLAPGCRIGIDPVNFFMAVIASRTIFCPVTDFLEIDLAIFQIHVPLTLPRRSTTIMWHRGYITYKAPFDISSSMKSS